MTNEQTLILVKPDGVKRGLVGNILQRFEKKHIKIVALKMLTLDEKTAKKHYAEHDGKAFFQDLIAFITSGPIVAAVLESENIIALCRTMMGATKYTEALPGTIRGDFAYSITENLIHGSDSAQSAKREIALFFPELKL